MDAIKGAVLSLLVCLTAHGCLAGANTLQERSTASGLYLTFNGTFTIFFPQHLLTSFYDLLCSERGGNFALVYVQLTSYQYNVSEVSSESSGRNPGWSTFTCLKPSFAHTSVGSVETIKCNVLNKNKPDSCYPYTQLHTTTTCPCISIWWTGSSCSGSFQADEVPCETPPTTTGEAAQTTESAPQTTTAPATTENDNPHITSTSYPDLHVNAANVPHPSLPPDTDATPGGDFDPSASLPPTGATTTAKPASGEPQEIKDDNSVIAIGAGVGCSLAAVLVVGVIALYIIRRRKTQHPKAKFNKNGAARAKPNQYMRSKLVKSKNDKTRSDGEDAGVPDGDTIYTEYMEPGSTYCIIGEDGVTVREPDRADSKPGETALQATQSNKTDTTADRKNTEEPADHAKPNYERGGKNAGDSIDVLATYNASAEKLGGVMNGPRNGPLSTKQDDLLTEQNSDKETKLTRAVDSKLKTSRTKGGTKIPRDLLANYNVGKFGGGVGQDEEETDSVRYSLQKDVGNTSDTERGGKTPDKMKGQATPDAFGDLPATHDVASRSVVEGGVESSDTVRYSLQRDESAHDEMKADVNVYSRLNAGRETKVPNDVLSTYNAASRTFDGSLQGRDNVDMVRYSLQKDPNPYDETEQGTNVYTQPDSGKAIEVSSDVLATYRVAAGTFEAGVEKRKHVTSDATPSNGGEDEAESPYDAYRISYAKAKPISEGPGAEASTNNVIGDDLGDLAGRGHDRGKGHGRDVDEYSSLDARRSGAPEYCMLQDGASVREGRGQEKDTTDGERGSGAGAGNEYFVLEDEVVGERKGATDGECVSGTDAGNEYFVLEDEVVTAGKEDEEYREDQEGEDGYSLGKVM